MKPLSDMPTPEQAGWIDWKGGECPVPIGTLVEVRHRIGQTYVAKAGVYGSFAHDWQHKDHPGDIVAYRVVGDTQSTAIVDATLSERGKTHGDYRETAHIAQSLKAVIRDNMHCCVEPDVRESLDLIATKIARILAGNPNEPDHWRDIAGYARLVEQRLAGGGS